MKYFTRVFYKKVNWVVNTVIWKEGGPDRCLPLNIYGKNTKIITKGK